MHSIKHHAFPLLACAAWLMAAQPARAEPLAPPDVAPSLAPAPTARFAMLDDVATADPVLGVAVRTDTLADQRGGTDTVNNTMALDGSVRDNVANHVVTGSNSIDAGSFANMAGIPTVIQNTGANVLIQNATIINLQFK